MSLDLMRLLKKVVFSKNKKLFGYKILKFLNKRRGFKYINAGIANFLTQFCSPKQEQVYDEVLLLTEH